MRVISTEVLGLHLKTIKEATTRATEYNEREMPDTPNDGENSTRAQAELVQANIIKQSLQTVIEQAHMAMLYIKED